MAALATVSELADWLGTTITDAADVNRAQQILDSVSGLARRQARQTFELVTSDTVDLSGTYDPVLTLPEQPVVAVNSVTFDGTLLTASQWELLPHGRLFRTGTTASDRKHHAAGTWGGPLYTVTVDYDHGWATVPEDVKGVVLAASARAWANPQGALYESVGSYRIGFSNEQQVSALAPFEVELLKSYRPRT